MLGECRVLFCTIQLCLSMTQGLPLHFSTLSTSLHVAKVLLCAFLGSLSLLWAMFATWHIFVSYMSVITLSFLEMAHMVHPSRIVSGIPVQAGSYLWKVDCCSVTVDPKYLLILILSSQILDIVASCGGETPRYCIAGGILSLKGGLLLCDSRSQVPINSDFIVPDPRHCGFMRWRNTQVLHCRRDPISERWIVALWL